MIIIATIGHRIAALFLAILLWLDEGVQILVRGVWFLLTGHSLPSAHETISAWIGTADAAGQPWAHQFAKTLDAIFGQGHCARAAAYESQIETPP